MIVVCGFLYLFIFEMVVMEFCFVLSSLFTFESYFVSREGKKILLFFRIKKLLVKDVKSVYVFTVSDVD